MTIKHLACTVVCSWLPFAALADVTSFNDKAAFLSATGAASASGALPSSGLQHSVLIGSVTFSEVSHFGFYVGGFDWTTLLAGNAIAINDAENLDVAFGSPVHSAGFDFVEPGAASPSSPFATDASNPYRDSTFTVTLKNNSTTVGAFAFNAPDEVQSFVGVWSALAFNRMEIRETTGGVEDEYFGQFYTGTAAPVPEPEIYAMVLAGLGLVALAARRRRQRLNP